MKHPATSSGTNLLILPVISSLPSRCLLCAASLIVIAEASLSIREWIPIEEATAEIFSWPAVMEEPADRRFEISISTYGADDGREKNLQLDDGTRVTAFYFEWARTEMGPMMDLKGHPPEVCNVAAGLKFEGLSPDRFFILPNGEELRFDVTRFAEPSGAEVYIFKSAWVQGTGSLTLRRSEGRLGRLKSSLMRHAGAARVIQGGVFSAADESAAWKAFEAEVLNQLVCEPR